jgi:hypothetical protein
MVLSLPRHKYAPGIYVLCRAMARRMPAVVPDSLEHIWYTYTPHMYNVHTSGKCANIKHSRSRSPPLSIDLQTLRDHRPIYLPRPIGSLYLPRTVRSNVGG